jgi:hypothetical protein
LIYMDLDVHGPPRGRIRRPATSTSLSIRSPHGVRGWRARLTGTTIAVLLVVSGCSPPTAVPTGSSPSAAAQATPTSELLPPGGGSPGGGPPGGSPQVEPPTDGAGLPGGETNGPTVAPTTSAPDPTDGVVTPAPSPDGTDDPSVAPGTDDPGVGGSPGPKVDFNGDGYADLAIGIQNEDVGRQDNAGAVDVVYGSSGGLTATGTQLWTQDVEGIEDEAEARDHFGWSFAAADYNGDGYTDLAVGAPFEDVAGADRAGSVNVIYGSPRGLAAAGNQFWTQETPDIADDAGSDDQFGWSIAAGDFDADGYADLVIGVKFEDFEAAIDAGGFHVIHGSAGGLTAARNQFWSQGGNGLPDSPETGDQFGRTLAAGDYDGDRYDDLAVGAPYERYRGHRDGRLHVLRGSQDGLTADGNQSWSQDEPGVTDEPDLRDQFGISLASADFDRDGLADLAIAVTFEDFDFIGNEGAVHILYGSRGGLSAEREQFWNQDSPGILDQPEQGDEFGQSLAAADYDGDGYDDLVVGVPREDNSQDVHSDPGGLNVIYGSSSGLTADGNQFFSQDTDGIADDAQTNDHFGEGVAGGDFNGDGRDDLAASVPWEDVSGQADAGAVHVLHGSASGLTATDSQFWTQGTGGLGGQADADDLFGWALSAERPASGTPRLLAP